MSEQNKTNLHNDLLHEKDNESFELPDINMAFNAADTEESIPSTSAAVANAPPFTISSCLRPVGRVKGGAQSAVSFHKKVTFKRVASTREFAKLHKSQNVNRPGAYKFFQKSPIDIFKGSNFAIL